MLVDIGLPGMDGYEVAREVRRDRRLRHVVLVALTGYGREEDREHALAAGFDRHLVKPVEPDTLERLVADLPAATARPASAAGHDRAVSLPAHPIRPALDRAVRRLDGDDAACPQAAMAGTREP